MLFVLNWFLSTSKYKMHGISELKEKLIGVHCASPYNLVHFIFIQMNFLSQWFASVSTRCSHCYTLQKSHDNIIVIHGIIVSWNITDLYIYLIQFDFIWIIIIVRLIALVLYTSEHNLIIIWKKKKDIMWILNMQWVIFILWEVYSPWNLRCDRFWTKAKNLYWVSLSTEIFQMTNRSKYLMVNFWLVWCQRKKFSQYNNSLYFLWTVYIAYYTWDRMGVTIVINTMKYSRKNDR